MILVLTSILSTTTLLLKVGFIFGKLWCTRFRNISFGFVNQFSIALYLICSGSDRRRRRTMGSLFGPNRIIAKDVKVVLTAAMSNSYINSIIFSIVTISINILLAKYWTDWLLYFRQPSHRSWICFKLNLVYKLKLNFRKYFCLYIWKRIPHQYFIVRFYFNHLSIHANSKIIIRFLHFYFWNMMILLKPIFSPLPSLSF